MYRECSRRLGVRLKEEVFCDNAGLKSSRTFRIQRNLNKVGIPGRKRFFVKIDIRLRRYLRRGRYLFAVFERDVKFFGSYVNILNVFPALVNNGKRQHVYVEPLTDFPRNIRRRIRSYLNPHNFCSLSFSVSNAVC